MNNPHLKHQAMLFLLKHAAKHGTGSDADEAKVLANELAEQYKASDEPGQPKADADKKVVAKTDGKAGPKAAPVIYQIDTSLPFAPRVNSDLTNIQEAANVVGPDEALGQAYSAAVDGYPGDPLDGTYIPGTTVGINNATTVQQMIADDYMLAPIADKSLADILTANVGPVGAQDWWNWSFTQWGLVPNVAADPSLENRSVLVNNGGVISTASGILLP
jgi:hypothetical protein